MPSQKKGPGAPLKGARKRSKTFSLCAMPEVVAWLDKQVRRLKLRSRSDWLEQLYRDAQKKYPADDQHGGASP